MAPMTRFMPMSARLGGMHTPSGLDMESAWMQSTQQSSMQHMQDREHDWSTEFKSTTPNWQNAPSAVDRLRQPMQDREPDILHSDSL